MKTRAFNINDTVRVRLTKRGREIHRANHEELKSRSGGKISFEYQAPKEDKRGWSDWQLWALIQDFGPHVWLGCEPPFETTIRIPKR